MFGKLAGVLKTVMPVAGAVLGSTGGGPALQAVAAILGVKPDAPDQEMADALARATPDELAELKRIDADLAKHNSTIDFNRESLAFTDRADARSKNRAASDKTPERLAYIMTALFGLYVGAVLVIQVWADKKVDSDLITGAMISLEAGIMAYYFGSSKSGDDDAASRR